MQSSIRAEEFLQAVYGRPLPSPGQSITVRAMVSHRSLLLAAQLIQLIKEGSSCNKFYSLPLCALKSGSRYQAAVDNFCFGMKSLAT